MMDVSSGLWCRNVRDVHVAVVIGRLMSTWTGRLGCWWRCYGWLSSLTKPTDEAVLALWRERLAGRAP